MLNRVITGIFLLAALVIILGCAQAPIKKCVERELSNVTIRRCSPVTALELELTDLQIEKLSN